MSEQATITVHLGASRIATDHLDCISRNLEKLVVRDRLHMISTRVYGADFRSLINDPKKSALQNPLSVAEINELKDKYSSSPRILISQHAMLGTTEELFSEKTILPKAPKRLANLRYLFSERSISLHLAIAPLSECFLFLLADDIETVWSEEVVPVHSWFDLVKTIQSSCPNAQLTVWDFDAPDAVGVAFLSSLLCISPDEVDLETRERITAEASSQLKRAKMISRVIEFNHEWQGRMDLQYEHDLQEIESLEGVTLVRSSFSGTTSQ